MHLMIAAPEMGRQWGGIGTYLQQLLAGIGPQHEVTILAAGVSTDPTNHAQVVPIAGGGHMMMVYANFQRAIRRQLPALLREYRPDLFLVNHAQMPDILVHRRPRDPPFVTIAHTTLRGQASAVLQALRDGGPMDYSERLTLAASAVLLPVEVFYWHRVRHAVFVSDAVRREVDEISTAHLRGGTTVPNGIDQDQLLHEARDGQAASTSAQPTIIYAGRMLGMKGLATLFRALKLLPQNGWSIRLAGAGALAEWMRFARSLGLSEGQVEFLGPVPRSQVLHLVRSAAMFVLPSYYESCPFSMIEAMALGVPCVATSIPGITAMAKDGESALLVPPGDPRSLARAIGTLLQDSERGRRIGERARRIANERFTASRMRADTFRVFERILAAG